jgi:2-hydroxy-3-keto-5-methylthiopentenyl-1-phosphate phosphatase
VKRIIFCDFDGTITVEETFVAMLRKFTPDVAAQLLPEIYAKRLTLRQGVRQMVASIPSDRYAEIIDFTRPQPIRPGFVELLDFCDQSQIPFVIISGGFLDMVKSVVEPYLAKITAIHAMEIDTQGSHLQVSSRYEQGNEIVAKAEIMREYKAEQSIAIGDSITDLNLALSAPIVFARPPLSRYLNEHNKLYIPWNDFFEIRSAIEKL